MSKGDSAEPNPRGTGFRGLREQLTGLRTLVFGRGGTFRNVLAMLSGTTLAQIIAVVGMVPLARLYSPTDFGYFAIIQALVTAGAGLAALRYDLAVVLPKSEAEGRAVLKLASRTIVIVTTCMAVVLLLLSSWVSKQYDDASFGLWLSGSAIVVAVMAQIATIQYWLTRRQNFRQIARNRVTASFCMVGMQLLLAPAVGGYQGLVLGMLAGQTTTLVLLLFRVPELRQGARDREPSIRLVARRYIKMPLLNAPNVAVDGLRNTGISVLIGNIALGGLGQYSLAHRAVSAPVYLINGAIAQVFLKRMATTNPGGMYKLIRALLVRIGAVSAPMFFCLYLLAPTLFPLVFGTQWSDAGTIAQALTPWLFMNTFTSPLANLYVRIEKQEWLLGFACIYAGLPLWFLATTDLPLLQAVAVLAWIMAGLLAVLLAMSVVLARRFDRGDLPSSADV